jgi:hypothetical protein
VKLFLLSLILFPAVIALAQESAMAPHTVWVQGNYTSFGQCDGMNANTYCIYNLKQEAQRHAGFQAQDFCSAQGGQVNGYGNCNTYCNPEYIQPGAPPQMVNCHSTCVLPCLIRGLE